MPSSSSLTTFHLLLLLLLLELLLHFSILLGIQNGTGNFSALVILALGCIGIGATQVESIHSLSAAAAASTHTTTQTTPAYKPAVSAPGECSSVGVSAINGKV